MTVLYLVRHGQTDWNVARRFQGSIDVALNHRGKEEAARLAQRLKGEPIDAIYCSDLARALTTAEPCALSLDRAVIALPGLRERNYGIFEGLTPGEIAERHPAESARWTTHDPAYTIPQGESQNAFRDRVLACLFALAATHPNAVLLVVTHGGTLDMVYRRAHSLPWDAARSCPVPNAALNRVRVDGETVSILDWADSRHLIDG